MAPMNMAKSDPTPESPFRRNSTARPIFGRVTRDIPRATVGRLPSYLRFLGGLALGRPTVSSDEIAERCGVTAAQVRKDLSYLDGSSGTRGVGYEVDTLRTLIARALGLGAEVPVVIVGAGNMGSALAGYGGFTKQGFRVAGIHDIDHLDRQIAGIQVEPLDRLGVHAVERAYAIGIIATPAAVAQEVATALVDAGVRAILNFAPAVVEVPPGVTVRQVDLATELQILAHYLSR